MEENKMNPELKSTNPDSPLRPGEVRVFSEENYEGQSQVITKDTPNLDIDFAVGSFRLGPKTGVTLFSDAEYQGLSQQVTAELSSLKDSKLHKDSELQDQKAKSLKIWLSAGKTFSGYWAIEVAEGRYLSVHSDINGQGVLTTSSTISDSEAFRIADRGQVERGRRKTEFQLRGTQDGEPLPATQPSPLTLDDLQGVVMVDETAKGPRSFSLKVGDNWIYYDAKDDRFRTSQFPDRVIFRKAIQLAEDESQVGELLQGDVALFENPSYWGKAWVLDKDLADFNCVSGLSNAVSSIQLGPLTGATIYREAQYVAEDAEMGKQDVVSNIPSLAQEQVGDNQIASLQAWQIKTPESLNISFTCSLSQDYRSADGSFKEYSAYRTTLRLPPTVESVEVWTTDQTEIEVDNKRYQVDEVISVPLRPNPFHSLLITTDAMDSPSNEGRKGSLKAPGLKIRTNTMQLHENIVIFPDRSVHERLANLKDNELWEAQYKDEHGTKMSLIKGGQKKEDVANAQSMVTKLMSTVKYTESESGGHTQAIAPEVLQGHYWGLSFSTYRVHATTLYVREGPGIDHKPVGFLRKDDKVEALEFSHDGGWVKLKRSTDGLTGWSSRLYLDNIDDRSLSGDRYQVTADTLYIREGPGIEYRAVGSVQRNEMVTAIGVNDAGTWRQICREDGMVGWSSASYLALVLPPRPSEDVTGASFRVTGSLNVRKGPGVSFPTLGYLQIGDLVEALETNADGRWLRVRRKTDGLTGWASKRYLVRLVPAAPASTLPRALPARLGYVLAPETRFYEASKESVAELLAHAESPDTDLAQSWFGDIFEAVKNCVSFVITEAKQGLAVIVNFVDGAVKWIVDTAQKAVAFVEGIFERIGMAIEEVIKWLRYVFDWGDILKTRDEINKIITEVFKFVSDKLVPVAQARVTDFFQAQRRALKASMNAAIKALGGIPGDGSSTSQTSSSNPLGGVSDTVEWVLAKIFPSGNVSLLALEGVDTGDIIVRVEKFQNEVLMQEFEKLEALPEGLAEAFSTLIKNPAEPLKAVADLLKVICEQLDGLLNLGEKIANGFLGFLADLISEFEKLINAKITIPFISDILKLLKELKFYSGETDFNSGFTLLDVTSLIVAVPFTAIYKACYGKAPFEGLPSLQLQIPDEWALVLARLGCVIDAVNGLIGAALDMQAGVEAARVPGANPEDQANLGEIFSTLLSVGSWLPNLYEWENLVAENPGPLGAYEKELKLALSIVDVLVFGLDGFALLVSKKRFKRWEEPMMVLATTIGIIRIVFLAPCIQKEWPDMVMALPEVASIALMTKNAYVVGFTLVAADLASSAVAVINWPVSLQDGWWETWS
jgi:uncharacterized protein YgiM (DUF1202 family)